MIIFLTIVCIILTAGLIYCMRHIAFIIDELEALSKEQHTQNMDIIKLWKISAQTQKFQLDQYKFNEEVAKGFESMADKDLVQQLQNIDPRKIGQA